MPIILPIFTALALAFAPATWRVVPTADRAGQAEDFLQATSAVTADDVWAVGHDAGAQTGGLDRTLAEHWNGSSWQIVATPNPDGDSDLLSVAALTRTDVWAVGLSRPTLNTLVPLVEHFDGTSWSIVPVPSPNPDPPTGSGQFTELTGVSAVSPSDVWATGWFNDNRGRIVPLFEHWNGTAWRIVAPPAQGPTARLLPRAISARAADDVWAVGTDNTSTETVRTLSLHWNGKVWSVVPTVNPIPGAANALSAVVAIAPNNVWAVGDGGANNATDVPLIEHFDGHSWTNAVPANAKLPSRLFGIVARSAGDIWAVGTRGAPNGSCCIRTLALQTAMA
ncbi:hypothetical protein [Amycolatopsis sp. NPDC004079]|uniref:hypothetical protein n=1 Tax=Amycolatopsis sp. NPDC004079 TaxID=3154549 RepID=UPI0033AB6672